MVTTYVQDNHSPKDVVLLCDDLHYLGFRHTMYYLPEFKVFQIVPMGLPPNKGIFWAENRHTYFSNSVRIPKWVKDCLIITHPQLLKEQVAKIEETLSPEEIKLISLSSDLGIIKIDVNNAPRIFNDISLTCPPPN